MVNALSSPKSCGVYTLRSPSFSCPVRTSAALTSRASAATEAAGPPARVGHATALGAEAVARPGGAPGGVTVLWGDEKIIEDKILDRKAVKT